MSDNITSSLPLYHHPHGHKTAYITTLLGLVLPHAVCTIAVLSRILSRFLQRKWHIDDALIAAAWLSATAVCVVYSLSVAGLNESLSNNYLLHTYIGLVCYQLSLCLTQLSVLSLYLRAGLNRRIVWTTIAAVVAGTIPILWMSIMQCYPAILPPQFFGKPVAICFAFRPLLIASTSIHVAVYTWLIILAVPMVFGHDTRPRPIRLLLLGVLSLSVFVIAAGLTRLLLGLHSHRGHTFYVMTILECDIAIISVSAVSLKPLLVRCIPRLLGNDAIHRESSTSDRNSTARRSIFRPRISIYNLRQQSDSGDLTSVVSYHGYPWTHNHTPARSKTDVAFKPANTDGPASGVFTDCTSQATVVPLQQPPRSFTLPETTAPNPPGTLTRRPSSTFFDTADDFAQYFPEYTPPPKSAAKNKAAIGLGIVLSRDKKRDSTGSQESFVMGLNDPASPTRLTRLTRVSGYSGETYTGGCDDDELRMRSKGDEYVAKTEGRATESSKNMETSFLDEDSDGDTKSLAQGDPIKKG